MSQRKVDNDSLILGMQSSAGSVLKRAVEHDENGRYPAALACYQEGVQLLLDILKQDIDKEKEARFRTKATEYICRAEEVKALIQKQKDLGTYHEHIEIENNAVGYSYEKIFGKYLDESVTKVEVNDAYIRNIHQFYNFLSLCELCVKSCPKLKVINLITGSNEQDRDNQVRRFAELRDSLNTYHVQLTICYSSTLHDREIKLDNGWIIKIGRGLDYFKQGNKFGIGFCDQSLRRCSETTVDIFFMKNSA